jgi:hypothetical protein
VQLALVGSMAQDDPEGWELYQRCVAYTDNGGAETCAAACLEILGSLALRAADG